MSATRTHWVVSTGWRVCLLGAMAWSIAGLAVAESAPKPAAPISLANAQQGKHSPAQTPPTDSPDEELRAIRQALIDKALEGPTRVRAWAWVDQDGALRERNEMTSDLRVRGVRVQAYTDIHKKPPVASIEANLSQGPGVQCRYTQGQWRLPMSVHLDTSAVGYAPLQPIAHHAIVWAQERWGQALAPLQRFQVAPAQVGQLTPYQRALWGAVDSQVGWRAVWQIKVVPVARSPEGPNVLNFWASASEQRPDHAQVQIRLSLDILREGQRASGHASQVVWSAEQTLVAGIETTDWTAPRLRSEAQEQLAAVAAQWAQALDQATQCDPLQYDVIASDQEAMRINGGANAGIQVGDRVVVMDAATVPTQVWDQGSLERVLIARVEAVDAYGAQLRPVAGQAPQTVGRWVALPY